MNNNRLLTNNPNINSLSRTQLHNDIKNLLAQPLDHKRKVKLVNLQILTVRFISYVAYPPRRMPPVGVANEGQGIREDTEEGK